MPDTWNTLQFIENIAAVIHVRLLNFSYSTREGELLML